MVIKLKGGGAEVINDNTHTNIKNQTVRHFFSRFQTLQWPRQVIINSQDELPGNYFRAQSDINYFCRSINIVADVAHQVTMRNGT